jgi:hypothetical protein
MEKKNTPSDSTLEDVIRKVGYAQAVGALHRIADQLLVANLFRAHTGFVRELRRQDLDLETERIPMVRQLQQIEDRIANILLVDLPR